MNLLAVTLIVLFTQTVANAAVWLRDLGNARLRQAAENKPILILFTGSDWCPACKRLKREVFMTEAFGTYADSNLILLEVDFPRHPPLPDTQRRANDALAQAYHVTYYPTVILQDSRGQVTSPIPYGGDGASGFLAKLDKHLRPEPAVANRNSGPRTARGSDLHQPEAPLFNGATTAPPRRHADLLLQSISGTGSRRLAMINHQTLGVGESARVQLESRQVRIHCMEIRTNSVILAVDGNEEPRELHLPRQGH